MSGTITTGKLVLTNTTSNQDAFDRLRVSYPFTIAEHHSAFDEVDQYNLSPLFIDQDITGLGATGFSDPAGYISMRVTQNGDKVIRQSKEYYPYQPGKSRLVYITGVLEVNNGGNTGILCRIGTFDDQVDQTSGELVNGNFIGNGHFFQLAGTTLSVVERSTDNTGTQNDIVIDRNDWNLDKLDGTGESGKTINGLDKAQLFVIDQEWLGVGRVRMGFIISGVIYYCHEFTHTGVDAVNTPYSNYAKLPIRYEIQKTTADATVGEMRMMCYAVQSEGGHQGVNLHRVISTSDTSTTAISNSSYTPLIVIRLKSSLNRVTVRIDTIDIITINKNPIRWIVTHNPTFSSARSYTGLDNSAVEYDISTGGTLTDIGVEILGGYASDSSSLVRLTTLEELTSLLPLVSDIAGNSDVICLAAITLNGAASSNVHAQLEWVEIF